jgi:hypothetical protein
MGFFSAFLAPRNSHSRWINSWGAFQNSQTNIRFQKQEKNMSKKDKFHLLRTINISFIVIVFVISLFIPDAGRRSGKADPKVRPE